MAMSQRSIDRFVRVMYKHNVPQDRWNQISRENSEIHRHSNYFNLALLAVQAAGSIAMPVVMLLVWYVNTVIVKGSFGSQLLHNNSEIVQYLINCISYVIYMFIPFILIVYLYRLHPVQAAGIKRIQKPWLLLPAIPVALTFYFAGNFLSDFVTELLKQIHLLPAPPQMLEAPKSIVALIIYAVEVCVFAPLMEEFLFRGVIMRSLLRYGSGFAIVMTSVLFAMLHGNLAQIPFAFTVGLALGYFAYRMDSVWVSVILHSLINGTSVVFELLSRTLGEDRIKMIYFIIIGVVAVLFAVSIAVLFLKRFFRRETPDNAAPLRVRSFILTPGFLGFLAITVFSSVLMIRIA